MKKLLILLLFLLLPLNLAQAESLAQKLAGRILLQVEANGEAWYVNPDSQKRFYLGRPADAFKIMREQGLGVSNKDFNLFKGLAPVRLAGKILLKVEDLGEAYYVNPLNLTMHYLGRPVDAFSVMRNLGLGITDSNLALITVDAKSSPVITVDNSEVQAPVEVVTPETDTPVATSTPDSATGETATTSPIIIVDTTENIATTTCVWLAEYFDNKNLFGSPIATSSVKAINFDWGTGGPEQLSFFDRFSIRYTASCNFLDGNYEFRTVFDDAIRVYLDNENFLQSWADNDREMIFNRERNITAGSHEVKVEYYESTRNAKVKISWEKIN
ncbi:MAG: PA14 domain-containing protein [bacterium]|nr:PA14 domain-containing protein [bacterium]